MVSLVEGVLLGTRQYRDKAGVDKVQSSVAVGDCVVSIPGACKGMSQYDRVIVYGDVRSYEGRHYVSGQARVMPATITLDELVRGLEP